MALSRDPEGLSIVPGLTRTLNRPIVHEPRNHLLTDPRMGKECSQEAEVEDGEEDFHIGVSLSCRMIATAWPRPYPLKGPTTT